MKRAFFVLIVLFFSLSVNAISWDLPKSIPANVNWSLYASLGNASYDRIQLFLDGSKVYETYWGPTTTDHSKVVSVQYNAEAKDLAVSFRGLTEGKHSVELKILKEGNLQDSLSESIDVFEPSSVQIANQAEDNINEIKKSLDDFKKSVNSKLSELDSLNASLEKLNSRISEVEAGLKATGQNTESLQSEIENLKKDLSGFTEHLNAVSEKSMERDNNTNAYIAKLKNSVKKLDLQLAEMKKQSGTPLAGFAAFIVERPAIAVGLLLVVIAIIIVLLMKKTGVKPTLFETGAYENEAEEETPKAEEIDLGTKETESESGKKGRWAFGKESEEKSKFHLSDLLWKK